MSGATVLRDSIWGDIELGERELALIDTPAFQRLRGVRQLGFTDLVYPGARHSRFEHSLGVAHLAEAAHRRLRSRAGAPAITSEEASAFTAAALLHDVGHYPFSHAVEELEVSEIRGHEELATEIITSDPIAGILRRRWAVDPDRVAWLVAGRDTSRASDGARLLRQALNSGLDVDKLDYLVRDARAANVPYGMVDVERLINSFAATSDAGGSPVLAVDPKGVAALQSLVFAKYLMFATVYWHHACRSAVAMLLRALQEGLRSGSLKARRLERADDASLISLLRSPQMPSLSRELAQRLLERRLYKRAVELGMEEPGFAALEALWERPEERAGLEARWEQELGLPAASILIDIPEPKALAADLPPVLGGGGIQAWDQASGMGTSDLVRLERRARRIRLFAADHQLAERVRSRWPGLLGQLSHFG